MSNTLADQYHDEHGRPITPAAAPAAPPRSPRIVPRRTLEPWEIALRERAEARTAARQLGPLANTPQARAAFHRDEQIEAKGKAALAAAVRRGEPSPPPGFVEIIPLHTPFGQGPESEPTEGEVQPDDVGMWPADPFDRQTEPEAGEPAQPPAAG